MYDCFFSILIMGLCMGWLGLAMYAQYDGDNSAMSDNGAAISDGGAAWSDSGATTNSGADISDSGAAMSASGTAPAAAVHPLLLHAPLPALALYVFAYSAGAGPLQWVWLGELIPPEYKFFSGLIYAQGITYCIIFLYIFFYFRRQNTENMF